MRDEHKVIILSVLTGLAFWLMDVLFDPLFYSKTYLELLVFGGSAHDLFMRAVTLVLIVAFGVLASRYVASHRLSEEKLREKSAYLDSILRSAKDYAISTADRDMRITYYNPVAERLHGYAAKDVINRTVQEVHTKDKVGAEELEHARKAVLAGGEYAYTVARKTAEGVRYIESRISGIYDRAGSLIGFANFSRDVTEARKAEAEREELIMELKDALAEVKTLSGLLPICSYCKKIRDDTGYWSRIETYIARHSRAEFTHSICPECEERAMKE